MNVFEGTRRIVKLVAALWVAGWVVAVFTTSPEIDLKFKIPHPGAAPIRTTDECPVDGVVERAKKVTANGTEAEVALCFLAISTSDSTKVIPIYVDPTTGRHWGAEWYSSEVREYTGRVANAFVLRKSDEEWIDQQWWPRFFSAIKEDVLFASGGLLMLFALSLIIGWVVRGFMGIPSGQDHKPRKAT